MATPVIDPRTGELIDPDTGQAVGSAQAPAPNPEAPIAPPPEPAPAAAPPSYVAQQLAGNLPGQVTGANPAAPGPSHAVAPLPVPAPVVVPPDKPLPELEGKGGAAAKNLGADPNAALLTGPAGGAGAGRGVAPSAADATRQSQIAENLRNAAGNVQSATVVGQALVDQRQGILKQTADASQEAVAKAEGERAQEMTDRKAIKERHDQYNQKAMAELSDLQARGVDTNRYFYEMSTPAKILAGIGVASGAFGAGPLGPRGTRGMNDALKIIQEAQQQDIDSQKADMQNRLAIMGKKLDLNREGFSQDMAMHEAGVQSRAASNAATMALIDKQAALAGGSVEAQQNFQQLKEQLQAKYEAQQTQGEDESYRIAKAAEIAKAKAAGGGVNTAQKYREAVADNLAKGMPEEQAKSIAATKYGLPVQQGAALALPPKGAGSARGAPKVEQYASAERAASGLADLIRDNGGHIPLTGPNAGAAQAYTQVLEESGYKPPGGWASIADVTEQDAKGRTQSRSLAFVQAAQAQAKAARTDLYNMLHGAAPDAGGD